MALRSIIAPVAVAAVTVPLILNYGLGYIDAIDRVGRGEDVTADQVLDAGTRGIRPGHTSAQVEQILGSKATPVASDTPGERCASHALTDVAGKLVVCYGRTGSGADERWLVTRARIES